MASIVPEGRLAVGMQLPIQAQSRLFAERWERDAGVGELTKIAQLADDLGFFYLGVCDHIAVPRERADTMGTVWYDTMTTLGYLAGVTSRIRLLTHVYVVPLRHPLVAAKAIATLDVLSRGRAILGVGAGHVVEEFALTRADFTRRGALLDDGIDVIRAAMAHEFPHYDGVVTSVADMGVAPPPVQPNGPPIWVGGSSPAALRRAGQRGDGWIPQGTPRREMPEQITQVLAHRHESLGGEPIDIGAMAEPMYVGQPDWDVGRYTVTGSADEHVERLLEFADMGVTHVQIRLRSRSLDELLEQMALFGEHVLPRLGR